MNQRQTGFKLFKMLMIGVAAVCIVGYIYFKNDLNATNGTANQSRHILAEGDSPREKATYLPIPDDDSLEDEWNQPPIFNPDQLQTDLPKAMTAPLFTLEKRTHLSSHLPHDLLMQVHGWANDPQWFMSTEQKNVKRKLEKLIKDKLLNPNDPTRKIAIEMVGKATCTRYKFVKILTITSGTRGRGDPKLECEMSASEDDLEWAEAMHCVNEGLMKLFEKQNVKVDECGYHYTYEVGGRNYFDKYKTLNIPWLTFGDSCNAQRLKVQRKSRREDIQRRQLPHQKPSNVQREKDADPVPNEADGCACVIA